MDSRVWNMLQQMEYGRKRDQELQKLQHELEELQTQHESQLTALRKKHQDANIELTEQVDQLHKARQR